MIARMCCQLSTMGRFFPMGCGITDGVQAVDRLWLFGGEGALCEELDRSFGYSADVDLWV